MGNPNKVDTPRVKCRNLALYIALAVTALTSWHVCHPRPHDVHTPLTSSHLRFTPVADEFDWFKLRPNTKLKWTSCYKKPLQCARLEVPYDYAKPHGQKAAVALIKYPSKYPVGHANWRGPILYNPGGPGSSGVDLIHDLGMNFSKIIGDDFDHIGFDPRGIGYTTPQLIMLPTEAERLTWQRAQPGPINSTVDALAKLHGYAQIVGELVQERMASVAAHMSTPIVARDMLQITKAHGRDKLLYWGFSYGTVLGTTFSAMFPDNVGQVIIDGVEDADSYYTTAWDDNLVDTDKGFAMVLASCAASSACPLRESSAELVGERVDRIVDKLKTEPVPVNNGSNYGIVDYSLARTLVFRALYTPFENFPPLFAALEALEHGDGAPLFELSRTTTSMWRCTSNSQPKPEAGPEMPLAIACSDGEVIRDSLPELQQFYSNLARSSSFADNWNIHAMCTGWKVRPVERFSGPIVGNTSHPLLFIGNTADPVTPLRAAKKMSKGFKDSVVLTQNSPGHCSNSATSLCTSKVIRAYFRNGTLPEPGTVCEIESQVFPKDGQASDNSLDGLSAEDADLLRAARDITSRFQIRSFGFL